ncbi:MAG: hypothetical protein IKD05_02845 [Tidjanibacter sp.]|nr:hypothetical protein [Tidjanibacter sp.]MBR3682112.1 hypothetical protein [Tidjanibacter sp.]MBR7129195.1 hypothetical protein [Tidjanibacter sp.]
MIGGKIKSLLSVWVLVLALVGCSSEKVDVLDLGVADHTLVMYLNANNNLAGAILNNANDAEKGMQGVLPSTKLVIYLDKNDGTSSLYEVKYLQYGTANYIKHTTLLKEYPEQVSTSAVVMRRVFEDVKRLVPSKSYGLVLAGHGSGWFPEPDSGISYDNQRSAGSEGAWAQMSPEVVSGTIADEYDFGFLTTETPLTRAMGYDGPLGTKDPEHYISTSELILGMSSIKFDYIIFDACFMASVEFLYELRNVTDYVIASPVEVMGPGMPYEELMPLLMAPEHDLRAVCEKIMEVYRNDRQFSSYASSAISLIDCSKLEALTESVAAVWQKVAVGGVDEYADVVEIINQKMHVLEIQVLDRMQPSGFYDFRDYVEQLAAIGGEEVALDDFYAALEDVLVYSDHTDELYSNGGMYGWGKIPVKAGNEKMNLCGLNCYLPRATAPITASWYFKTPWARSVYGL